MKYIKPRHTILALLFLITFVAAQQISVVNDSSKNNQFSGFELDNNISTVLIQNEIIRVSGVITDPKFYVGFEAYTFMLEVNFTLKGDPNVNFTCRDIYPLKNLKFDISCRLRKVGEFLVSLSATPSSQYQLKLSNYPKKYENTSNLIRKIIPFQNFSFPTTVSKPAPKPEGFKLNFINNDIQLKWTSQAPLTNITFYQNNSKTNRLIKKEFLLSGNHQIFYPDFFEFRYFYPGETIVEISHASSQDGTLRKISSPFTSQRMYIPFKAIRHLKKPNNIGIYKVNTALPTKLKVGQKYNLTMIFLVRAKTIYYKLSLDQKDTQRVKYYRPKPDEEDEVKQNVPFTIEMAFDKPGTYLLAFQTLNRKTILNQPIYVGEGTPFLPDYFDYYEYFFQNSFDQMLEIEQQYIARYLTDGKVYKDPGFDAPIQQQRVYLFDLLNYERRKYKAIPMVRDQILEKMAQDHCQDMLNNKFFSSLNKKGKMPIDRASRYNLTSFVDQYLMESYSLGGLHLDTQILGPMIDITANMKLTRVGIGIVVDRTKYPFTYIVTYDFTIRDLTISPPDPVQLQNFRLEIIKVMIQKNPSIIKQNKNLSADISTWIKQRTEYISEDLEYFLDKKWSKKNKVKVWSREVFFYQEQLQNIKADHAFDNKEGTEIGLGLVVDKASESTMSAFVVFI